jgi:hypothetical protein
VCTPAGGHGRRRSTFFAPERGAVFRGTGLSYVDAPRLRQHQRRPPERLRRPDAGHRGGRAGRLGPLDLRYAGVDHAEPRSPRPARRAAPAPGRSQALGRARCRTARLGSRARASERRARRRRRIRPEDRGRGRALGRSRARLRIAAGTGDARPGFSAQTTAHPPRRRPQAARRRAHPATHRRTPSPSGHCLPAASGAAAGRSEPRARRAPALAGLATRP